MSGFVSDYSTASVTLVNYYVTLFRVRLCFDRSENSAAIICPVAGVYINVQGTEAERAMIARCVAERQNLASAVLADKTVIVFCKSLVFHVVPLTLRACLTNLKLILDRFRHLFFPVPVCFSFCVAE